MAWVNYTFKHKYGILLNKYKLQDGMTLSVESAATRQAFHIQFTDFMML